jgi:iron complex outermembrane receptor protein
MIRLLICVGRCALVIAISSAAAANAAATDASQSATPAASTANSNEIEEIIVTAQKRSESLQKIPMAVTAVTSAELQQSGIQDLQGAVALVPNLNLGQQLGMAKIALRGIGLENISAGAEGSIAFNVDGVFISRSIAALSSFYDVQQLEVLRGPQGTLYGRNATGGAVNITTREPTQDPSGYFDITGGNYGRVTTEGAVSGPIVPGLLAARVAFQSQDHDGYGTNIITGNKIDDLHTRAIRGTLLFTPTDRLTVDVKADYFNQDDHSGGYHFLGGAGFSAPGVPITPLGLVLGGTVATNVRDISNEADPTNHATFWGTSGKITFDLGGNTQISSLTAYRSTQYHMATDLDSTSAVLAKEFQSEVDTQLSEELQLSGKSDRLDWLLGLYYFHEKDDGYQFTPFNNVAVGFPPPGTFVKGYLASGYIETDALAVFGQASYKIVDKLSLTLGARYSSEKKTDHDAFAFDVFTPYNGPYDFPATTTLDRSKRWPSFTPRVALDYEALPDVLLYTSWSRGFKSGTYNLGGLEPPVNPETVSAIEAGVKSSLFDRRLRLNLAGFHYDYKNLQIGKVVQAQLALENAAAATIYGLEAEMKAQLTSRFDIDANAAWLHARFDQYYSADPARPFGDGHTFVDALGNYLPNATAATPGAVPAFNLAGNSLSQAPNFTAFLGAQYHVPTEIGTLTLRGEVSWRDRVYFTPFNVNYVSQAANTKLNAFLNWDSPDEHWNGSLFVKNLTNKTTVGNSLVSWVGVGFPVNGYLEDPRTYGLRLGYKF